MSAGPMSAGIGPVCFIAASAKRRRARSLGVSAARPCRPVPPFPTRTALGPGGRSAAVTDECTARAAGRSDFPTVPDGMPLPVARTRCSSVPVQPFCPGRAALIPCPPPVPEAVPLTGRPPELGNAAAPVRP